MKNKTAAPSLFLLLCLLGFPQISETIYTPSLPDLAHSLNICMEQAEFTLSIYFSGFAVGVLIFGILSDRIGRRRSILFGLLIYTLASIGCSLSPSINSLLFFRFLQALGASAGSVVTQTMMRDLYSGSERNRVFSIASGALAFSPAIGPVIGGIIDQLFQWRANFYALVIMGILFYVYCFKKLIETKPIQLHHSDISCLEFIQLFQQIIIDRKVIYAAFLVGGCNGLIFSYYGEAPYIFIEILKLAPSTYGFLGIIVALSFLFSSFISLKLNRFYRAETSILLGSGLSFFGALLFTLVCSFENIIPTQSLKVWIEIFFSIAIIFTGIGIIIPNCLSQALSRYKTHSGTAASIFGFIYYCLISGFTTLMGILHNGSVLAMPIFHSVLTFSMLVVSILFFVQCKKQSFSS